jgi:hypothetical protein
MVGMIPWTAQVLSWHDILARVGLVRAVGLDLGDSNSEKEQERQGSC